MPDAKKWRVFERIVAAIHHAESKGAKVTWNDKIKGRQFDVTVRFKLGLYEYLTIIECKDEKRRVEVTEVEAFATKARRYKANKAIMVSSSGYQEGCLEAAKEENIELYILKELINIPKEILSAKLTPALHFSDVVLHPEKPKHPIELPMENNILTYIMKNCLIKYENEVLSLEQLIEIYRAEIMQHVSENERSLSIAVDPTYRTCIPYLEKFINVSAISFSCKISPAKLIDRPSLDPSLLYKINRSYEYSNILNGTNQTFPIGSLGLGLDTQLQEGKFYAQENGFYYYCRSRENNTVIMDLIESYQHGSLFQALGIKQDIKYEKSYVEALDPKVIARLRKVLTKMEVS